MKEKITKAEFINTWASEWDERTGWKVSEEYHKQFSEQLESIINQEVEKRIKERMPSEEVNQPIIQRPEKKYTYQDIDIAYATGVFNVVGIDGMLKELKRLSDIGKSPHDIFNSCLTCSEKPNNSQKTEGGEG